MAIYLGKNQVSAVGGQYINGIDTSNATVLPEDIKKGKIAYANGQEIIGTMDALKSARVVQGNSAQIEERNDGSKELVIWGESANIVTRYISPETMITMEFNEKASDMFVFGDAEPSQVLEGKTFTSMAGFTKTGTIPSVTGDTIIPTTDEQTVVNAGSYVTGDIKIGPIQTETQNITANGTYTPTNGKYFSSITVNVPVGKVSGDIAQGTAIALSFGTSFYYLQVTYSTSVVDAGGVLSLDNPTSINASAAADLDVVKGKYVSVSSMIYYIPEDATITYSGNVYNKSYNSDKANPVFILA